MDLEAKGMAGAQSATRLEGDVRVLIVDFIGAPWEDTGDLCQVGESWKGDRRCVFLDGVTGAESKGERDGEE